MADVLNEDDSINSTANTPADEDSGQASSNPSDGTAPSSNNTADVNNNPTNNSANNSAGPTNINGSADAKPGKRLKNPLGQFASYTYQISLYMITPDAYDAFVLSGRKNINAFRDSNATFINENGDPEAAQGGAFLIAQSGGINNTTDDRAPGFNFDYGIDNLTFATSVGAEENGTSTNTTDIKFNITEPYGFSFITKLKAANQSLAAYAQSNGNNTPQNPLRNFYILGVRFYGYDQNGTLLTGNENFAGGLLDPNAQGTQGGLFTKYWDIQINKMNFKIDGKAVIYSAEASILTTQTACTLKRGMINHDTSITANTVDEALGKLFKTLNDQEQALVQNGSKGIANTYNWAYNDVAETDIGASSIVSPADLDKYKWPGSGAQTPTQSNPATETKQVPKNDKRTLSWNQDTPLLQAIEDIIKISSYLEDALIAVYSTALETNPQKDAPPEVTNSGKKPIRWYNCSPSIANPRWDNVVNDWAFDMTFIISTYETPVINAAYAHAGSAYYGPHKRYEYWYTGQNTEILHYEQNMDTTYSVIVLGAATDSQTNAATNSSSNTGGNNPSASAPQGPGNSLHGPSEVPIIVDRRTSQPRLGKLGVGMEAQNNFVTAMNDKSALATATVQILGDPDFLMTPTNDSLKGVYSRFYGTDGYTINPNGGQVFIEINFKEAIDYNWTDTNIQDNTGVSHTAQGGILDINDSILFWKYPDVIQKDIDSRGGGISYKLITVDSVFSNGKFTQTLHCQVNDFADSAALTDGSGRENENTPTTPAQTNGGPNPGGGNTSTSNTGLVSDNPSNQTQPAIQTHNPVTGVEQPTAPVSTTGSNSPNPNVITDSQSSTRTVTVTNADGTTTTTTTVTNTSSSVTGGGATLITASGAQIISPTNNVVADDDGGVIPPRLGPGGP